MPIVAVMMDRPLCSREGTQANELTAQSKLINETPESPVRSDTTTRLLWASRHSSPGADIPVHNEQELQQVCISVQERHRTPVSLLSKYPKSNPVELILLDL